MSSAWDVRASVRLLWVSMVLIMMVAVGGTLTNHCHKKLAVAWPGTAATAQVYPSSDLGDGVTELPSEMSHLWKGSI